MRSLDENHAATIPMVESPQTIARAALATIEQEHLLPGVKQNLAASAQDYENESHICEPTPFNSDTLWSEVAEFVGYSTETEEFEKFAHSVMSDAMENAEHDSAFAIANRAAEIGRALSRHFSEKSVVDAFDGKMAKVSEEGDAIDVKIDGKNVQVFTCFASSDSTRGKPAKEKMDEEKVENVDRYVVLHADVPNEVFGVGVNNLNDGIEAKTDATTQTAAKNATETWGK